PGPRRTLHDREPHRRRRAHPAPPVRGGNAPGNDAGHPAPHRVRSRPAQAGGASHRGRAPAGGWGRRPDHRPVGLDPAPHLASVSVASIRVATYNIHRGYGRDRRQDLDRVAAVLGEMRGDVLALQEVDSDPDPTEEDLLDHLAHLAEATGFHAVTGPTLRRRGMAYGNLLLSRLPVEEVA